MPLAFTVKITGHLAGEFTFQQPGPVSKHVAVLYNLALSCGILLASGLNCVLAVPTYQQPVLSAWPFCGSSAPTPTRSDTFVCLYSQMVCLRNTLSPIFCCASEKNIEVVRAYWPAGQTLGAGAAPLTIAVASAEHRL